jgi:hypothetical protein
MPIIIDNIKPIKKIKFPKLARSLFALSEEYLKDKYIPIK